MPRGILVRHGHDEVVFRIRGRVAVARFGCHRVDVHYRNVELDFDPTLPNVARAATSIRRALGCRAITPSPGPRQGDLFAGPEVTLQDMADLRAHLVRGLRAAAVARRAEVAAADDAVVRAVGRSAPLLFSGAMLAHPYLLRDVTRFRAAAAAVAHVDVPERAPPLGPCGMFEGASDLVARLADWQALYVHRASNARSVARTLAAWGESAPLTDLVELPRVPLERPVASLAHLQLLAEWSRVTRPAPFDDGIAHVSQVMQRVTPAQLEDAVERTARAMKTEAAGPAEKVHVFAELLFRSHSRRGRTLGALAKDAIAWFDTVSRATRRTGTDVLENSYLALPPIPAPDLPGVTLLLTPGEVVQEGAAMGHCVATLVGEAREGRLFVFHVDHGGQRATVAVDEHGDIADAQGPCNRPNRASAWGQRVLGEWGEGFPGRGPAQRRGLEFAEEEPAPPAVARLWLQECRRNLERGGSAGG